MPKSKQPRAIRQAVTDYWLDFYVDEATGMCLLCCNKGIVTLGRTVNNAGTVLHPRRLFCACPNGQTLRACKADIS